MDYFSLMAKVKFSYLYRNINYFKNRKPVIFKDGIVNLYELKSLINLLGQVSILLKGSSNTSFIFNSSKEFIKIENSTFKNNLVLIDSLLPEILSNSLLAYFSGHATKLPDICKYLTATNPLNFNQTLNHKFYEHKLKRFLSEVALGMMPNTIWTGEYDGTEGYIIIKEDGDVVCYHIINRNLFEDYLLANTKFDTPSSTRHLFGSIYDIGSESFFKLNLQIRFI